MANVFGVKPIGNSMGLLLDDGNTILARPTASGVWIVSGPEPDPEPGPSDGMRWPFNPTTQGNGPVGEYGPRWGRMHWGFDFGSGGVTEDTPIHVCGNGRVLQRVVNHKGWGNYVVIDHGNNLYTLYAHMVRPAPVSVGQAVAKWDIIGNVGNTGASQGNHLHWETYEGGLRQEQAINPRTWMARYGEA